jgi:hypothetical protein
MRCLPLLVATSMQVSTVNPRARARPSNRDGSWKVLQTMRSPQRWSRRLMNAQIRFVLTPATTKFAAVAGNSI